MADTSLTTSFQEPIAGNCLAVILVCKSFIQMISSELHIGGEKRKSEEPGPEEGKEGADCVSQYKMRTKHLSIVFPQKPANDRF